MKIRETLPIIRITGDKKENLSDTIVIETPITIFLNDQEIATIICTPENILYLTAGYLFSERFIRTKEDIIRTEYNEKNGIVRVEIKKQIDPLKDLRHTRFITPGCMSPGSFYNAADAVLCKKVESNMHITTNEIITVIRQAQLSSRLFRETGGVHSAALCSGSKIVFFIEDIGRHNALDKIIGRCLLEGMPIDDKMIITSGRISSEVLLKIIKAEVPILISRSAPTTKAVSLSKVFGVTLVGFARGKKFNIYSNEWRVTC